MPLINCKLHLELNWTKNNYQQKNKKNNYLKDLKDYYFGINIKVKIESHELDNNNLKRTPLDSSFQGINR